MAKYEYQLSEGNNNSSRIAAPPKKGQMMFTLNKVRKMLFFCSPNHA